MKVATRFYIILSFNPYHEMFYYLHFTEEKAERE